MDANDHSPSCADGGVEQASHRQTHARRTGRRDLRRGSRQRVIAQLVKGRHSDAGGLRFESQAGRVTGKSTQSLWRDMRPAIKSLQPPEHLAGKFNPDHKRPPRVKQRSASALDRTRRSFPLPPQVQAGSSAGRGGLGALRRGGAQ